MNLRVIAPSRDVLKGFADLGQRTQVMMLLHEVLVTLLFEWTNEPDKNPPQIQDSYPQRKYDLKSLNTSLGDNCPELFLIS